VLILPDTNVADTKWKYSIRDLRQKSKFEYFSEREDSSRLEFPRDGSNTVINIEIKYTLRTSRCRRIEATKRLKFAERENEDKISLTGRAKSLKYKGLEESLNRYTRSFKLQRVISRYRSEGFSTSRFNVVSIQLECVNTQSRISLARARAIIIAKLIAP
jgi:hypothetical protein